MTQSVNCASIYGGTLLQTYVLVIYSSLLYFLYQYLMVHYILPFFYVIWEWKYRIYRSYTQLQNHLDMMTLYHEIIDQYIEENEMLKHIREDELNDMQSLMNVLSDEEQQMRYLWKYIEKYMYYYYALFVIQFVVSLAEILLYAITTYATNNQHKGDSSWIIYTNILGFMSNSSSITLVHMAVYFYYIKETYLHFKYYWAEDAKPGEIVYYLPNLYEQKNRHIVPVQVLSVDPIRKRKKYKNKHRRKEWLHSLHLEREHLYMHHRMAANHGHVHAHIHHHGQHHPSRHHATQVASSSGSNIHLDKTAITLNSPFKSAPVSPIPAPVSSTLPGESTGEEIESVESWDSESYSYSEPSELESQTQSIGMTDQGNENERGYTYGTRDTRYRSRFHIRLLHDEYLDIPKKCSFLHLYCTWDAAKLEMQFQEWEKTFEVLVVLVLFLYAPMICTHIIPGLVLYGWIFVVLAVVAAGIVFASIALWFGFGPGVTRRLTDRQSRKIGLIFSTLLLRILLVVSIQSMVNYMVLYYDAIGPGVDATLEGESPSFLYIHHIVHEYNLRVLPLTCFISVTERGVDVNLDSNILVLFNWV